MSENNVFGQVPVWEQGKPIGENKVPRPNLDSELELDFNKKLPSNQANLEEAIERFSARSSEILSGSKEKAKAITEKRTFKIKELIVVAGIVVAALLTAYGVNQTGGQLKSTVGETLKVGTEAVQTVGAKANNEFDYIVGSQNNMYGEMRDAVNAAADQKKMEEEASKHGLNPEPSSIPYNPEQGGNQ